MIVICIKQSLFCSSKLARFSVGSALNAVKKNNCYQTGLAGVPVSFSLLQYVNEVSYLEIFSLSIRNNLIQFLFQNYLSGSSK